MFTGILRNIMLTTRKLATAKVMAMMRIIQSAMATVILTTDMLDMKMIAPDMPTDMLAITMLAPDMLSMRMMKEATAGKR